MIGDVLISSLLCDNLRNAYPDAQIDYLVYESTIAVLQGNKSISNLILFKEEHKKSKWLFFKLLLEIRKTQYDIVIDAYAKIESFLPVMFSGAKRKISFAKKWQKIIFTDVVEKIKIAKTNLGLVIEQRLSLLNPLHLNIDLQTFPKIFVAEDEVDLAKKLFEKHRINAAKKTIMISIIGSAPTKTYPLEYMSEIIDAIADDYDINILFNYLPNQIAQARMIFNLCKKETQSKIYFDVLGKNIREFIAIMNNCDLIIGNDGGAINMSKALNKPSFIIFSPWIDKKGWATFEDGIKHISVHLNEFKPELFVEKTDREIKSNYAFLYNEFKPDLFISAIKHFLRVNL
jgi:heptosyltransferase-2